VLDADKIISVSKFKTHEITGITAAIKNMYGSVVGLYKTQCHATAPNEKEFAKIIAEIFAITRPVLNICDAVWCMEGEGPSAGKPRKTAFLMASSDGVAVDSVLATLIGCKPADFAVIRECKKMELGESSIENIEILGANLEEFIISKFKMAKGMTILKHLPLFITKYLASKLRFWPEIDNEVCKKCNLCKLSCPVRAISVNNAVYSIDKRKCVRCMCCHEVCPYKAIGVRKSWLAHKMWE
jgi:ferredoxin